MCDASLFDTNSFPDEIGLQMSLFLLEKQSMDEEKDNFFLRYFLIFYVCFILQFFVNYERRCVFLYNECLWYRQFVKALTFYVSLIYTCFFNFANSVLRSFCFFMWHLLLAWTGCEQLISHNQTERNPTEDSRTFAAGVKNSRRTRDWIKRGRISDGGRNFKPTMENP